jgi:nicotinamidase-related amidase
MSEQSKPTALVVIDVQGAMMDDYPDDPSPFRKDEVLANIGTMLENARAAGSKVIFVRHVESKYPLMSPGRDRDRQDRLRLILRDRPGADPA